MKKLNVKKRLFRDPVCVCLCGSVATVDTAVQVLVFRVVRGLSEAVSRHPITLAHGRLAPVVGRCGETGESVNVDAFCIFHHTQARKRKAWSHLSRSPGDWSR